MCGGDWCWGAQTGWERAVCQWGAGEQSREGGVALALDLERQPLKLKDGGRNCRQGDSMRKVQRQGSAPPGRGSGLGGVGPGERGGRRT